MTASSPTPPPFAPASSQPVRILYADDVRELRELASVVFRRDGHHVETAVDGVDALERLMSNLQAFDLLITDHHMPRMNGFEFVQNVRRLSFKGKIIVFSSELNPAVTADYKRLGVDRILFKPVYPSVLRQTLRDLFPGSFEAADHEAVGGKR